MKKRDIKNANPLCSKQIVTMEPFQDTIKKHIKEKKIEKRKRLCPKKHSNFSYRWNPWSTRNKKRGWKWKCWRQQFFNQRFITKRCVEAIVFVIFDVLVPTLLDCWTKNVQERWWIPIIHMNEKQQFFEFHTDFQKKNLNIIFKSWFIFPKTRIF